MVNCYCNIYDNIVLALQEEKSTIKMNEAAGIAKARKVCNMLAEINVVTVALQESMISLAQGLKYLDEPGKLIHPVKNINNYAVSQCKLKLQKSAIVSYLSPDHKVENGVIKIQSRHKDDLTADEEEACTILLKNKKVAMVAEDTPSSDSPVKIKG